MDKKDFFSKFYWGDWRKDGKLSQCSRAEKGAWMDFLAYVFELDQPGYAVVNGHAQTVEEIAQSMTGDQAEYRELFLKLVAREVVAVDEDTGAYYSKRMAREHHIRKVRSEAGRKGGKAAQKKQDDGTDLLGQKVKQKSKQTARQNEKTIPPGFVRWWSMYPGKCVEKPRCLDIWTGRKPLVDGRRRSLEGHADAICEAVTNQINAGTHEYDGRLMWPNSGTWLYNARWEDGVKAVAKRKAEPRAKANREVGTW